MWYFKPAVDKIRDGHSVGTVDKIAGIEVKKSENRAIFKAFFFVLKKVNRQFSISVHFSSFPPIFRALFTWKIENLNLFFI